MAEELVFTVSEGDATAAAPVSFAEAGLRERTHFQEWVLKNPSILGPGIMIVTFEFGRWITAGGEHTADRLDVLGLHDSGHLVVAELKRDRAPDWVTMQALNYAAMVSRFSLDTVAEAYAAFRGGEGLTPQEAVAELQAWAPAISDETIGAPRIMILATEFGPKVTNVALYLYENGIDITLIRVQPYRTHDNRHVVTVSRVLPVPNSEEFMVKPRSGIQTRAATTPTTRREWDWDAYEEVKIPSSRLAVARRIVEELTQGIEQRGLPWHLRFRQGQINVQRSGNYNVLTVDLVWKRPLRLSVRLPETPENLELENLFPDLPSIWVETIREWGWHIERLDDIPDLSPLLDLAERFHNTGHT